MLHLTQMSHNKFSVTLSGI